MKVYLETPTPSLGLKRVYDALIKYRPDHIQVTYDQTEADLVIFHVNGRNEGLRKKIETVKAQGKEYAMIQYVLKSTKTPEALSWADLWADARCVWSYYNLDEIFFQEVGARLTMNFYYAPLGVEEMPFKLNHTHEKEYVCAVNTQSYLTESAREIILAAENTGKDVFLLGETIKGKKNVRAANHISDFQLAEMYGRCEYVSGLRRTEGFEQPIIEGLLAGARPIIFDRTEMRHWFEDFAVIIPELPREGVIEYLTNLFNTKATPVTEAEKVLALNRFNWSIIIEEFWRRVN